MSQIVVVEIKDLIKEHAELRERMEIILSQIEQTIGDNNNFDSTTQEDIKNKLSQQQSTIDNLKKRLRSEQQRSNKLQNDLVNTKRKVFIAIEQGNEALYKIIGFEKPIEKVNREVFSLRKQNNQLNNNIKEASVRNETLETELLEYQKKIDVLTGLTKRLENEREDYKNRLSTIEARINQKLLSALVNQVTPRRLATLLSEEKTLEREDEHENLQITGMRLVGFLRNENVTSFYKKEEMITITRDKLPIFELDTEFEENCNYKIISPGIKLGNNIIVKPKVEKIEEITDESATG